MLQNLRFEHNSPDDNFRVGGSVDFNWFTLTPHLHNRIPSASACNEKGLVSSKA